MWRHCVFVAISVVAVAVGACSKESNSTRDGRSMEDARTVDTSSESAADVRDSGEPRDTATEVGALDGSEMESDVDEVGDEGETDAGLDVERHVRSRLSGFFEDFHVLDSRWAVTGGSFRIIETSKYVSAIGLLDVSDGEAITVRDRRVFEDNPEIVATTVLEGRILVALGYFEGEGDQRQVVGNTVKVFEVDGGALREIEDLGEAPFGGPPELFDAPIRDLVARDGRAVLITTDHGTTSHRIVTLEFDETDSLQIQNEISPDGFPASGGIANHRFGVSRSGYLLEVSGGVAVWNPMATEEPFEIGRVSVDTGPGDKWSYLPELGHIVGVDRYTSSQDGSSNNEAEVIDVSDPANPTLAAKWHVKDDFTPTVRFTNLAPFASAAIGSRLYWSTHSGGAREARIYVVDLAGEVDDPDVVENWTPEDIPQFGDYSGVDIRGVHADDNRLFIEFDANEVPAYPEVPILAVEPDDI